MRIDPERKRKVAEGYTAAWNSGSAEAVTSFYAPDGRIVINRGDPWEGRAGVTNMMAGFFADVPDLSLVCDGLRIASDHPNIGASRHSALATAWPFGKHAIDEAPARQAPINGGSGVRHRRLRRSRMQCAGRRHARRCDRT